MPFTGIFDVFLPEATNDPAEHFLDLGMMIVCIFVLRDCRLAYERLFNLRVVETPPPSPGILPTCPAGRLVYHHSAK